MNKHLLSLLLVFVVGLQAADKQAPVELPKEGEGQPMPDITVQAMASRIDALLDAAWKTKGIQMPAPINDEVFLRRAYTEIAGRIPNLDEIKAFDADKRSNRRAELIKKLIHSPAATSHDYNLWADTLRVKDNLQFFIHADNWQEWLKQALAKDMPWPQMTRAMLAAEGRALETGNGATGFLLREGGMPLDKWPPPCVSSSAPAWSAPNATTTPSTTGPNTNSTNSPPSPVACNTKK